MPGKNGIHKYLGEADAYGVPHGRGWLISITNSGTSYEG